MLALKLWRKATPDFQKLIDDCMVVHSVTRIGSTKDGIDRWTVVYEAPAFYAIAVAIGSRIIYQRKLAEF